MTTRFGISVLAAVAVALFSTAETVRAGGGPGDPHGSPTLTGGGPGDPHGGSALTGGGPGDPHGGLILDGGGPGDPHGDPIVTGGGPGDPHGSPTLAGGGPGDPHGGSGANTGLGQASPAAANVSQSTAWTAYEFERDGIQYLQVNDRRGNVRVIVGNIGTTFFTLPAGSTQDRVSLPQQALAIPDDATRVEIYRKTNAVLAGYKVDGGMIWSIEAPDGAR